MIPELTKIFGSRSKALEILYLLNDVKPVVRQGFYDDELLAVKEFCKKNKLALELSDYKVIVADPEKPFSNKGYKAKIDDTRKGMLFAYISKNRDKANLANIYEMKGDHRGLGQLLGYPECCVNFFVKNAAYQSMKDYDLISCTLENSRGVRYPFQTNISKRAMDFTLLSHFPCSFNCEKSIALARKHLSVLGRQDTNLAMKYVSELKCRVAIGRRFVEFH